MLEGDLAPLVVTGSAQNGYTRRAGSRVRILMRENLMVAVTGHTRRREIIAPCRRPSMQTATVLLRLRLVAFSTDLDLHSIGLG